MCPCSALRTEHLPTYLPLCRYSLTSETRALTKFLKCVDWSDANEAQQAADLMQQWAMIDTADALELLSPDFRNPEVWGKCGGRLRKCGGSVGATSCSSGPRSTPQMRWSCCRRTSGTLRCGGSVREV